MEDIKLTFTGKMSILIELSGHGPLEFRVNDLEVVKEVTRIILHATDNITSVNSYNAGEQKTLQKILDGIT
jgi:hypothetical protein